MTIFGPLIDNDDVEKAVGDTIGYWIDSYLAEKERDKGLTVGQIARPRSYLQTYDADNWPEGQLPAIAIVCPGTVGNLELHGSGEISAWFDVTVNAMLEGTSEADARKIAAIYASSIGTLVMQKQGLNGAAGPSFATDVNPLGWTINLADIDNRTLATGSVRFHVLVDEIMNSNDGPVTLPSPPEAAPPDGPTVSAVTTTVVAGRLS